MSWAIRDLHQGNRSIIYDDVSCEKLFSKIVDNHQPFDSRRQATSHYQDIIQ
jgi:hypothetical protein